MILQKDIGQVGKIISHFKILKKLGEGGMGVVYKAEDTDLKRTVALKFLPAHLLTDKEEKTRFRHEAQSASALNHSNITTIYEIGEVEGQTFIAMECVEGETLKDKVEKGPLKTKELLNIAIAVADGLNAAHEHDIVHRDIKSENIMISKTTPVKIMDFGLAKRKGMTKITKTGSTLGTLAYMSPEQAEGLEVDRRSDLFSFGVVMYEMATGQLPFKGEHDAAIMYSIVNEAPISVSSINPNIPQELERIIHKALEKEVEDRYQHADDLSADLKKLKKDLGSKRRTTIAVEIPIAEVQVKKPLWGRDLKSQWWLVLSGVILVFAVVYAIFVLLLTKAEPRYTSEVKMLAVLPFENLGAAEDEYFASGITEEITTHLAGLSGLGVISRTSAMKYKNTGKSIREIGSELGVDYILEGTIRWDKSGTRDRVRINPQLIMVSDDIHIWAETYDRVFEEIFVLQSNISEQVASALDIALLEPEQEALKTKPTDNLKAFDYYLRGNQYFDQNAFNDKKSMQLAAQLYQKAVESDSNFILAYAKLSRAYIELYWHQDRRDEDLTRAKQALDKAMELNRDLPEVHMVLGSNYYHEGDFDRALGEFALAREKQPHNSDLLAEIGYVRRRQGKMELAITNLKKAVELDPLSITKIIVLGDSYLRMRHYSEAENYIDHSISLAPDIIDSYVLKAWLYVMRDGDTQAARRLLQKKASGMGKPTPLLSYLWALIDACAGDYKSALEKFAVEIPNLPAASYYNRAAMYGLMGESELEHSYYDSARIVLEQQVASAPQDARYHSGLGIVYTGLGRREDAIREGELAAQLAPISQDALQNYFITVNLAATYTMVGEFDAAIDQLEVLLSMPSLVSTSSIRINPMWKSLRGHPRFQKLLGKYLGDN